MMKKLICLAMCLLLCLLACAAMADAEYQEGIYRFSVSDTTGEATILGVLKNYEVIKVPDTLQNSPVTAIGSHAFYNNQCLREISLPESVKSIGDYAFAQCTELETVEMAAVETIGASAFEGSTVHVVKLPATLTEVGKRAFAQCMRLYSIDVPGSLAKVSEEMFCDSRFLHAATLREGVAELGDKAFCGTNLEEIVLPQSMTDVGVNPFIGCDSLISVRVGANPLFKVEQNALIYVPEARLVSYLGGHKTCGYTMPADVKVVGVAAFAQCYGIKEITVPATVEAVSDYAFWYCTGLTTATVADGVYVHPTAFAECYMLTNAQLPADAQVPALPVDPKQ